jgi:hypothetical protein
MSFRQSLWMSPMLVLGIAWIAANETGSQQNDSKSSASFSKRDRTWVGARVADWQPTPEERAFDRIGWAKSLVEAERLAKEHARPIFLFTYNGANMACFRC